MAEHKENCSKSFSPSSGGRDGHLCQRVPGEQHQGIISIMTFRATLNCLRLQTLSTPPIAPLRHVCRRRADPLSGRSDALGGLRFGLSRCSGVAWTPTICLIKQKPSDLQPSVLISDEFHHPGGFPAHLKGMHVLACAVNVISAQKFSYLSSTVYSI